MTEEVSGGSPAGEKPKNDFKEHDVEAPKVAEVKPPQPKPETSEEIEEQLDDGSDEGDKKPKRGGYQKKIAKLEARIAEMEAREKPSVPQPKPEHVP